PRSTSLARLIDSPATRTSPGVGSSSPPRSCSNVVLPDPEAPMIATRSPFATLSWTPRSTSILRPTSAKVFTRPIASSTTSASLITQRLGRRLARGHERGIQRREDREHERENRDLGNLERPQLRGQVAQEIDVRRQQIYPEPTLQQRDDVAELPAHEQRERDAERRADQADQGALAREDRDDASRRRAEAAQDRDVAALVAHDHHERRHDVERGDRDHERQDHEHDRLLELNRPKVRVVLPRPVGDVELFIELARETARNALGDFPRVVAVRHRE